jgi:hypothetical protein
MAVFNIKGVKTPLKPMVIELEINVPPPPLTLLMNPESLDIKFASKVTEQRVRWIDKRESGYILHTHHDELDMMSASGKTALFYTDRGLTSFDRQDSLAWENIQKFIAIYRNNGINFNSTPGFRGSGVIDSVGRVMITYDGFIYRGSFESLTINETEEKPFNLDFSFDYKITNISGENSLSQTIFNPVI